TSVDSYPALLDFLRQQEFADSLVKVNFKPIVRSPEPSAAPLAAGTRILPLIPVGANGAPEKPLNGTCMSNVGKGTASACDTCNLLDDNMTFLRDETKRRGFPTPDGVHNGPCHVHLKHAHTIGPDGSLYACPGFTGDNARSTGHIDERRDPLREEVLREFD